MRSSLIVAVLALLLPLAQRTAGHGLMLQPRSRNWLAYLDYNYYWSHGLNSGGVKVVSDNGALTWPEGRTGMCGDAYNETRWDVPGEAQATYASGQNISVDFVITVNHLGRVNMALCDLEAKDMNNATQCQQLQRADGKGTHWYLPYLANWTGGNAGDVLPAYGDGSFEWYRMPEVRRAEGCTKQEQCNQFMTQVVYRVQWKLPQGFSCRKCKLVWSYLTAHSCWPPCPDANADEPTCKNSQVYPYCDGTSGDGKHQERQRASYPETFVNCADISVAGGEAERADTKLQEQQPLWAPSISLQSGKFGSPQSYRMVSGYAGARRRRRSSFRRRLLGWLRL